MKSNHRLDRTGGQATCSERTSEAAGRSAGAFGFISPMVKFVIFIFLMVASLGIAEELPNPPIAHDANSNGGKQKTPTQNEETEASNTRTAPQGIIIKHGTPTINAGNTNQESSNGEEERMWPPSSGWATAYIAAAYTVVSFLQWRAIRRTAKIAETSLRKIGRADLRITHWQLIDFVLGKEAEARCFYINAGQRRASIKKIHCGHCVSERLPPIPDYKKLTPTYNGEPIPTYPRDKPWLPCAINNIEAADYVAVDRNEKRLYFYGCFLYDDVLDGEHKTTFFAWYDVDSGQFSPVYDLGYNTSD